MIRPVKLDGGGPPAPSNPAKPVGEGTSTGKPKVLLVDSRDHVRFLLGPLLMTKYEVLEVGSPAEAKDILQAHPDIALIYCASYNLIPDDGIEFARTRPEHIKFILMGVNIGRLKETGFLAGIKIDGTVEEPIAYVDAVRLADAVLLTST